MSAELWGRLATVLAAGGVAIIVSLLVGSGLVPLFQKVGFVSRESKEGVARGRRDVVPMGGGFILLIGVTITVLAFTALAYIRWGYAFSFLIAFWGFGLLGFLDDHSKTQVAGYSDRVKVVLQVSVTLTFAIVFYTYASLYVTEAQVWSLSLPFVGPVAINWLYIPLSMLFLFFVSNAVNVTDGFNGLAGGTAAVTALAYTAVTFLLGAYALSTVPVLGPELGQQQEATAWRMFSLGLMAVAIAGSCVGYLYHNFVRGSIYFGDTGSMALGAALAFLALLSRTEIVFFVIGGVFTVEALSAALQRIWKAGVRGLLDRLVLERSEPALPFIIAPLHHHFEHLLLREMESPDADPVALRAEVRRRLTIYAWALAAVFGSIGVLAQYGWYRSVVAVTAQTGQAGFWSDVYNFAWLAGLVLVGLVLAFGVYTRLRYDCYFLAPDPVERRHVWLYRGLPIDLLGRRLFSPYERTTIGIEQVGYLAERIALFRLFFSRVDARVAFGLLHFQAAEQAEGEEQREHLRRALAFWQQVPLNRYLECGRHGVLSQMAECHRVESRYAEAVKVLETLQRGRPVDEVLAAIGGLQDEALDAAEDAWLDWRRADDVATRERARAANQEVLELLRLRYERLRRTRERLETAPDAGDAERAEAVAEIEVIEQALAVAAERVDQLQPPDTDELPTPAATGTDGRP